MLKRRYQVGLVIAVVLGIFYPAIFAEFCTIDDTDMVTSLLNTNDWSLKELFLPNSKNFLYYRPMCYMTYLLDKDLWFLQGSFMHLENILLHLVNVLIVYRLALMLVPEEDRDHSYLPLIAALLFGLHPITTESVNWISGRTDLMAGTFVLLSALALLTYKYEQKKIFLGAAAISLVAGMLCKEVALGFVPGAVFILTARIRSANGENGFIPGMQTRHAWKGLLGTVLLIAGSVAIFFLLRSHAASSNSSKIGMTLTFMRNDIVHTLFVFLRTFGFYMKKIYFPFPLNFTIVEVDPLYELLAMPLVLICIFVALQRTFLSAMFLSGVFLLTPSFPLAFNQIAWTPYAERYVYIASAFVVIATVLFVGEQLKRQTYGIAVRAGVPCLLAIIPIATFQRNLVWRTNLTLFADTVKKSPDFCKPWNELGLAYYAKKDLYNAEKNLAIACSLYSFSYDERQDLNLAIVLQDEGKWEEAGRVYRRALEKSHEKTERVLEYYVEHLRKRVSIEYNPGKIAELKREQLRYNEKLYKLNKKPVVLFRMGVLAGELGDRQKALNYFREAYEKLPPVEKGIAKQRIAQIGHE